MSLKRFALYFLSTSACAVALFPCMVPSTPAPQYSDAFNYPAPYPPMMTHLVASRKSPFHHHHHLAPSTIVASN